MPKKDTNIIKRGLKIKKKEKRKKESKKERKKEKKKERKKERNREIYNKIKKIAMICLWLDSLNDMFVV